MKSFVSENEFQLLACTKALTLAVHEILTLCMRKHIPFSSRFTEDYFMSEAKNFLKEKYVVDERGQSHFPRMILDMEEELARERRKVYELKNQKKINSEVCFYGKD